MSAALTSGQVAFKPRARLLKLIGAELISDEVVAVTELIKNAHDADATTAIISFRNVVRGEGEIVIEDNGTGMNVDDLLHRWMEPAHSWKSRSKRTRVGRRVLGEKGVGRFATDKLGSRLELVSRRRRQPTEVRALFDWDRFADHERMLSEIKNRWEVRLARSIDEHGTRLVITGLRSVWNERLFRRLSTRLARLISPFDRDDGFRLLVDSDEFPDYSGEVRPRFLESAPYRIDAIFDGDRTISSTFNNAKTQDHTWNGNGALRCGPVRVRLHAFDLETEAVAKIGPRMEVRAWLREWSGVSLYRDGFRVWPYGEPHDDWLRLDQRRVNNPVVRLSNNQVIGFVEIAADSNPDLRDQTSREGLIHNAAYEDLRRLVHFVLQMIEAERQRLRHPKDQDRFVDRGADQMTLPGMFTTLVKKAAGPLQAELKRAGRQFDKELKRWQEGHRRFVEGYSDLAAVGQAVAGLQGAVGPELKRIHAGLDRVVDLSSNGKRRALRGEVNRLRTSLGLVEERLSLLSPLANGNSRKRRSIDVVAELESTRDMLGGQLEEAGVLMKIEAPKRGLLRAEMRPESFRLVMHCLAQNSLDWMERGNGSRIHVEARLHRGACQILFSDRGTGIPLDLAERVFEPLFSRKEGGRGMGLTIARNLVRLHGGEMSVLTDRRRKGATVTVQLPRKRSRVTASGV